MGLSSLSAGLTRRRFFEWQGMLTVRLPHCYVFVGGEERGFFGFYAGPAQQRWPWPVG